MQEAYIPSDISQFKRATLIQLADTPLKTLMETHKLSLSEFDAIQKILGRLPTLAELGVFSAMWSEHCSYKSSKAHLKRLPTSGENVLVGPGENAGIVRLENSLCIAFKMESHNHPSYIDPYQGAATGVGGILRDVFCMGARPIANLNALRFGSQSHPKTSWLLEGVVKGIGDYGNCVGIPTVGGSIGFDSSFDGNILVNAMTVGLIDEHAIFKGQASGPGNLLVYVGSATGRDGIHGATMASDSFSSNEQKERAAIQVGDPFAEKLLLEATLEALEKKLVSGIQDMGAAGLTSSLFEMADRGDSGLLINLDSVPVRAPHMSAYELLLSESQERMVMVVEQNNWSELKAIFEKWGLAHAIIGVVTDTNTVQAHYQGKMELEIPVKPLATQAPLYHLPMSPRVHNSDHTFAAKCSEAFAFYSKKEIASLLTQKLIKKSWIYEQFDHHIGRKTVLGPDKDGAAILWLKNQENPHLGIALAAACNETYCFHSPTIGAAHTVLKAARSIFASGSTPLAITDCLNFGSPLDPKVMWEFSECIDGIKEACLELSLPVVSGNVSFYNETDCKSIKPTPMIGMVGKVDDVNKVVPSLPASAGSIFLLQPKKEHGSLAASLIAEILEVPTTADTLPPLLWAEEIEAAKILRQLIQEGTITFSRDLGRGGLIAGLLRTVLNTEFTCKTSIEFSIQNLSELSASYIFSVHPTKEPEVEKKLQKNDLIQIKKIGCLQEGTEIEFTNFSIQKSVLMKEFSIPT